MKRDGGRTGERGSGREGSRMGERIETQVLSSSDDRLCALIFPAPLCFKKNIRKYSSGRAAMEKAGAHSKFLIDGFPRDPGNLR